MTLIKSISGIRGTIGGPSGENLTPPDVVKFTTAYVRLIAARTEGRKPVVVVGRDARISGEMVANLVEGTLLACGADVINAGLCTTPGTEMAVIVNRADGGIIITASHNPRQWNALKLLNSRGEFLSDAEGKQVLAMSEEEFDYPEIDAIGHVLSRAPFNDEHIRRGRAQTPLQGGRRCGELRGRRGDPEAAARTGLRGRGTQLRADGRFRAQPRAAAREPYRNLGGGRA